MQNDSYWDCWAYFRLLFAESGARRNVAVQERFVSSVWISGTCFISSGLSSLIISLMSTSPRWTAPITLAANGILSSFLNLIHCITDLKTNVSQGALRSSRLRRRVYWSASIWDKNSSLSQISLYIEAILVCEASWRSFRPCRSAIAEFEHQIEADQ